MTCNGARSALVHQVFALSVCLAWLVLVPGASNQKSVNQRLLDDAYAGDVAAVRVDLVNGADVNAKDSRGFTALMRAGRCNSSEVAKVLLEHGADVNAKNSLDFTAPLDIG